MKKGCNLFTQIMLIVGGLLISISSITAQITLTATGGTPTGNFTTISAAFSAINAGTHTGVIDISINANTTEPLAPVALFASGLGVASYSSILIRPTAVVTVSGATNAGFGVINFDGSDNVTINGSIIPGGTTRDLSIRNTSVSSQANVAVIRLIGRTTLGLGTDKIAIKNCKIVGNTPGNNATSGSTVVSTYGIYAGSIVSTTMSNTTGGADYDRLTIENNEIKSAYIGIHVYSTTSNISDSLKIIGNTIGSATSSESIGFRGISCSSIVNADIANNTVSDILNGTSVNIAAIEIGGTASNNVKIRKNVISNIYSTTTADYGAHGINISDGTNTLILNNVIHGILATNYNSTSTSWHPFGIRLAGGSGHKIYYNSVNMFGNHTLSTGSFTISAAFVVTSTSITGLDVRNNIFANKHTSTIATNAKFIAVWFPSSYNFANVNLNNNAYMVTNDLQHVVGALGTNYYATLSDWKAISQVGNTANDVLSQPVAGNSNAPFTSDTDLTIVAGTTTPIESGAIEITGLGTPNTDFTGTNRPAGSGVAPDMGAYEFEGDGSGDFYAPVLSTIITSPSGIQCSAVAHTIEVTATDNVGVTSVILNYSFGGVVQTPISLALNSGTATNGTWIGVIPAASMSDVIVSYSIIAIDAVGNSSSSISGTNYKDGYLIVTASADQTINTNTTTTVSAHSNDPSQQLIVFSEIVQYMTGTGSSTYPGYIPQNDNDFIELTNISNIPVNLSGFEIKIQGSTNGTYTIPSGVVLAPSGVLVLAFVGIASDPANFYYGMNFLSLTSSGIPNGYTLRNQNGVLLDAVAIDGYVFNLASGVTAADWTGIMGSSSTIAGIRRTGTDSNTSADWALSSLSNVMNIGTFNAGLNTAVVPSTSYSWAPNGGITPSINVGPYATPGAYTHVVSYNDGTCTAMDSVVVNVQLPTAPVANFVASQVLVPTMQLVTLTDLSTNIPDTWSWVVTPATFNFVNATSATSQSPQIEFTAAGIYNVVLTVSNGAGTDTETKLAYITAQLVYCNPGATSTIDTDIGNVTFAGINNGNASPTMNNPNAYGTYSNFTTLAAGNVQQGASYPISISQITSGSTFYNGYANVFIDYDQNGVFDPVTERVFSGGVTQSNPTVTGIITIPPTAFVGSTRMRVSFKENGNNTVDPCEVFSYGETEDYLINISAGVTCSGSPSAANTVASVSSVCNSIPFNVSLDHLYSEVGITYQWQSSPNGISYSNITGATSAIYTTSQTSDTYYQVIVTCANGGVSTITNPFFVEMAPLYACYCNSGATSSSYGDIGNVTFGGINNGVATPVLNNITANGTYSDFTSITAGNVLQGGTYPINVSQITPGAYFYESHVNVFIDLNQDGIFNPVTERVYNAGPTTELSPSVNGLITIPVTAATGLTRMRVILVEGGNGLLHPCATYTWGETEDYLINIGVGANCAGSPVAANTLADDVSVCAGDQILLSLDHLYQEMGISYQWQVSSDGITYATIPGATNPTHTTSQTSEKYYRAIVTCSNSALSANTTPVLVEMNGFVHCYCTPLVNYTSDTDIGNVTFGPLNNGVATPMINNPNANGTYTDFTSLAPQTFSVGVPYPISVTQYTTGSTVYSAYATVFIDYNHDGLFDPLTESVFSSGTTSSSNPTLSGTVTIPSITPSGLTRMRVILQEGGTSTVNPCGTFNWGEVEDYIINIGCAALPAPTAPSISICENSATTLSASAVSGGTLAWYDSAIGGIQLATGSTFVTPSLSTTTSYWVEETENGCSSIRKEVVVTIGVVNVSVTVSGVQLTANSLTGFFKWIDCGNGNTIIPGETGLQFTPTVSGSYAVIVTEGSCVDTSGCIVVSFVGIDKLTVGAQSFNVNPNPSTGLVNLTVTNTKSSSLKISLIDIQGKVVFVENVNNVQSNYSNIVDVSKLAKGIYYVEFKAGDATEVQKLVIE